MHKQKETGIGETIKSMRKRFSYTQKDLAKAVGVSASAIGQFERGEAVPTIDTIIKIADALHVPVNALIYPELDYLDEEQTDIGRNGFKDVLADVFDNVTKITLAGETCYVFTDGDKNYYMSLVNFTAMYIAIKPLIKQFVISQELFAIAEDTSKERIDKQILFDLIKKSWERWE